MTVAKNVLNRIHVQRLLFAAALFGVSLNACATWVNKATGQAIWDASVRGRTTTLGVGNGAMIVVKPPSGGGWTPAGNYGVAPGVNGGVKVGGSGTLAVGEKSVPVNFSGELAKEAIVGGVVGCATGGIVGCALGIGTPLAIAYLSLSGSRLSGSGQGLERTDPSVCTVAPCSSFRVAGVNYPKTVAGLEAACRAWAALQDPAENLKFFSIKSFEDSECTMSYGGTSSGRTTLFVPSVSVPPASATWYPATPQEVKDALIAAGPPPPGIVPELADTGVDWNKVWPGYAAPTPSIGVPQITGPSSITGPKETTTNPDGSTSTKQSSTPMTYGPGTVTAGPTTTTTTTTNSDGSPRETTSTVTEPGNEADKPDDPPKDPCEGHPVRLGCIDIDVPEGEIPKTTKNVTFEAEDPLGGGACPANVIASFSTLGGQSATIVDWQTFCGQALPLRALVMGLAAIMAFFIIMPGGVRE